jgi:hypothetical protein
MFSIKTLPFFSDTLNLVPSSNSKSASARPEASGGYSLDFDSLVAEVFGDGFPLATFVAVPEQDVRPEKMRQSDTKRTVLRAISFINSILLVPKRVPKLYIQ